MFACRSCLGPTTYKDPAPHTERPGSPGDGCMDGEEARGTLPRGRPSHPEGPRGGLAPAKGTWGPGLGPGPPFRD